MSDTDRLLETLKERRDRARENAERASERDDDVDFAYEKGREAAFIAAMGEVYNWSNDTDNE